MKFIHLSDLHLGKRVNEYSLIEDQEYILKKILNVIDDEKPDAVIIAGDIYDKSIPSVEAVELFDDFLVRLSERKLQVIIISGNHDSPERLSFGNRLMTESGVHICSAYDGKVDYVPFTDKYGTVNVYMLPFIKPVNVRKFFPDTEISSYTDAMRTVIDNMDINEKERNILVTHQFVTGAERCDSEEISVGGSDNVDASVFDEFDYVALGHIHRPQNILSEHIRYCGTPLKYSFSEANDEKSVSIVELLEKGTLSVRTVPLVPLRDMVEIKGKFDELMLKKNYEGTTLPEDYLSVVLTDEDDVTNALAKLRVVYKNIMKITYDNKRTRGRGITDEAADTENKSPIELFSEFYEMQNSAPMSEEQRTFVEGLIEGIWGENK